MRLLRTFFLARKNLAGVVPLLRDPRVPISLKIGAAVLALLVFTPVNILGYIPIVGFFDDAALLMLIATWFSRVATGHVERNVTNSLATQLANR